MEKKIISTWTGSQDTFEVVRKQIGERWGEAEVLNYDPAGNCLTFNQWLKNGYKVKKGEKAIKSYTFREMKDEKGEVVKSFRISVNLFYVKQVEKMKEEKMEETAEEN